MKKVILVIILAGIILRGILYLQRRSLWHDEAALLMNLKENSLKEIVITPLKYQQIAPIGFLILSKIIYNLDKEGKNELIIRFLPFLLSLISVFILPLFLKEISHDKIFIILSFLLFIISEITILYSAEFKHYSSDILFSVLFSFIYLRFLKNPGKLNKLILFISGPLFLLFSFTLSFLFVSFNLFSFFYFLRKKDKGNVFFLIIMTSLWLLYSACYYFLFLSPYRENSLLFGYWKNFFFNFLNPLDYLRFIGVFISIFHGTLGLRPPILVFLLFLSGLFVLYRENKLVFKIVILNILFPSVFAFLKIYPFHGRLLCFMIPFLLIPVGMSYRFFKLKKINYLFYLVWIVILARTSFYSLKLLIYPHRHELKKAIEYVEKKMDDSDLFYVSNTLLIPFKIYMENSKVIKKNEIENILKEGKRVWVILEDKDRKLFENLKYKITIIDSVYYFRVYVYLVNSI